MPRMSDYMKLTSPFKKVNIWRIVRDVLQQYHQQLKDSNQDQLWRGEDARGKKLPMPYAPRTITDKSRKGQPIDRITLKDTGRFYKSIRSKFKAKDHEMISNDDKIDILIKEWGRDILGLQKQEIEEISEMIKPEVARRIFEVINKNRNV